MERLLAKGPTVSFKTLTDFSQLSVGTKNHLKNVYTCLVLCTLSSAGGAFAHVKLGLGQGGFLSALVSLGLMMWLASTSHVKENQQKRLLILSAFGASMGVGLGPLLNLVIAINPQIVLTSLLMSSMIFVCFSLCALYSQQRSLLFLGGPLMSMMSIMLITSLLNIFVGSFVISKFMLICGIGIFSAFILYDTQLIVEKHKNGDHDYIWHSVDLFLDFINLFRRIMILLASNEKKKNN